MAIRKFGRATLKFEHHYLYLYIQPFADELKAEVHKALDALNSLLTVWKPPEKGNMLRSDVWWDHIPCSYCKRRAEREIKRWKAGKRVWHRRMCLRHWFVCHLSMIIPYEPLGLLEDRPMSIVANSEMILFSVETVNYKYNIKVTKEMAEMEVTYKGTPYRFIFRNHPNAFPYTSSYMILFDIHGVMEIFKAFLTDYVLKRRLSLVINDSIALLSSPDTAGNCPACRLHKRRVFD